MQKICLVVIYNHNFEKNIDIIRRIYRDRFSEIIQLMPFYQGRDSDVVGVYGNSFQFQQFIVQAKSRLINSQCDRFLFIGDDLILNPQISEETFHNIFGLDENDCYISKFQDVSQAHAARGTREAHSFKLLPDGIDRSALNKIPSYEQALEILQSKGLLRATCLRHLKMFFPLFLHPLVAHPFANYRIIQYRLVQVWQKIWYLIRGYRTTYPVVFGYSDIFSLPKKNLLDFCDFLEVFASIGMFVELAIPTTFALHDWPLKNEDHAKLVPLDIWFPNEPIEHKQKVAIIKQLEITAEKKLSNLAKAFPSQYLYIHPVKLSSWS